MPDLEKIRFLTVNYSRLQGLKAVPLGLLLFLTVLWTNARYGPAKDLTLPLLMLMGGMLLYAVIDRYYKKTYGRVEQAGHVYGIEFLRERKRRPSSRPDWHAPQGWFWRPCFPCLAKTSSAKSESVLRFSWYTP
jgi:hypothetical protein